MRTITRGAVLVAMGAALVVPAVLTLAAGAEEADDKVLRGPKADGERGERGGRFSHGKRGHRDKGGKGGHMKYMLGDLDLTDEQKGQIKELGKANREAMKAWHKEHKDEIQAINKQIQKLHEQKRKLMKTSPMHQKFPDQIRGVLDEEQQKTFDERIEKMKKRHEQMKERGKRGKHGKHREGRGKGGDRDKDSDGVKEMLDL